MSTASPPIATGSRLRAALGSRASRLVSMLVLPAALTLATLRHLAPSRMEGREGGLTAFVARLVAEHPLIACVVLFVAIAECARYWRERLGASAVADAPTKAKARSGLRSLLRTALLLAAVVGVALGLRGALAGTYRVVSPSMLPTLEVGDRLLVNRMAYGMPLPFSSRRLGAKLPRRGDVVVFDGGNLVEKGGPRKLVKRVVGLPGDQVAFRDGRVVINGWVAPACDAGPYVTAGGKTPVRGRLTVEFLEDQAYLTVRTPAAQPFPGFTVPADEVFVIGDDRSRSSDSRSWNDRRGAGVPVTALEGRVARVLLGERADGTLDLSRRFARLAPKLHEPAADTTKTDERIATCVKQRPPAASPPRAKP